MTLPSVGSMFAGKYVHKTNVYHPRRIKGFDSNTKIISQYFKEDDYFTQMISGNRKQHLCNGFVKVLTEQYTNIYSNIMKLFMN